MRRLMLSALLALIAFPATAQVTTPKVFLPGGQSVYATPSIAVDTSGNYVATAPAVIPATSTSVGGNVATSNTFQSVLAANASRKGCLFVNTSAAVILVFLGAPGSATAGTSIPVAAGGSFNCGSPQGLVVTDQLSATSVTQGATFVVVSQ